MSERPDEMDARMDAYLDDEMTREERAAFEARMETEPALRRRVDLLRRMDSWSRETRPRPSPALGRKIERAIARAGAERTTSRPAHRFSIPGSLRIRWRWALVAAPVAAAVMLLVLRGSGGGPGPSPELAVTGTPGEAVAPSGPAGAQSAVAREFVLDAGSARQVCLVGDFNRWTVCATPLERGPDGRWRVTYALPPGRHEYMFVVDDEWRTDPGAAIHVDDGFGNRNAVLLL